MKVKRKYGEKEPKVMFLYSLLLYWQKNKIKQTKTELLGEKKTKNETGTLICQSKEFR